MLLSIKNPRKIRNIWFKIFISKSYFNDDGSQNFLIFQPISKTFTMPAGVTETIIKWLSTEKVKISATVNNSFSPKQKWHNSKIRVEFKGSSLKQDKVMQ